MDTLEIKVIAEVETRVQVAGHAAVKLAPADRLVPGDQVIYTLQVKNVGNAALVAPTVTRPVPEHMQYVGRSAAGPGAEVTYSVDGGQNFDRPERLTLRGNDGVVRTARAADYTHIRWQLKRTLKPNSVAFARFRAVVK